MGIQILSPKTYYLSKKQMDWIALNLKGYSEVIKETPQFIHVIDNRGEGVGTYIQLHVTTETQIIQYNISGRSGISLEVYDCNRDTLKVMTILSSIHNFNSPTLDDEGIEKMKWFDRLGSAIICNGQAFL